MLLDRKRRSLFWKNLSTRYLTHQAIKELNLSTIKYAPAAAPHAAPPQMSALSKDQLAAIQIFAQDGGPSLEDIRGYESSPLQVHAIVNSLGNGLSSLHQAARDRRDPDQYDNNFEQKFCDFSFDTRGTIEPENGDAIRQTLDRRRSSLVATQRTEMLFLEFRRKSQTARSAAQVMDKLIPILLGDCLDPLRKNRSFDNMRTATDGSIDNPQPGYYEGTSPRDLHRRVRIRLGRYIIPDHQAELLPNFFIETGGIDSREQTLRCQAMEDLVYAARGMFELQQYRRKERKYNEFAFAIAATYSPCGMLDMYVMHADEMEGWSGITQYHLTKIASYNVTESLESFLQAASALRSAREWARLNRTFAIYGANRKVALRHREH